MKTLDRKQIFVKYKISYLEDWEEKEMIVFAPDCSWDTAMEIANRKFYKQNKITMILNIKRIYG